MFTPFFYLTNEPPSKAYELGQSNYCLEPALLNVIDRLWITLVLWPFVVARGKKTNQILFSLKWLHILLI